MRTERTETNSPGRRWIRIVLFGVGGYIGVVVLVQIVMFLGVLGARLLGKDPRANDPALPDVKHLRVVDDKLWAGAQPTREDFRALAEYDVTLVVDLRSGSPDDPRRDDPEFLSSLGMDYLALPVRDGHAPTPGTVATFVQAVEEADGRVFMHCGGGVGRSTSLQSAYEAAQGEDPSFLEKLAVGPPTIEQAWFVVAVEPGDPAEVNWFVQGVSRVIDAPRRLWSHLKGET